MQYDITSKVNCRWKKIFLLLVIAIHTVSIFTCVLSIKKVEANFSDLIKVNTPEAYPWRMTVRISSTFSTSDDTLVTRYGSGVLIDPRHILTAGHCIYAHTVEENGISYAVNRYAGFVEIYPGASSSARPYGVTYVSNSDFLHVREGWVQNLDNNQDLGIITLERPVGALTGWFKYNFNDNCSFFTTNTFYNMSYPHEAPYNGNDMYHIFGTFDSCPSGTEQLQINKLFYRGMSGSGFYIDNSKTIYAVLTCVKNQESYACRLTEDKYNWIRDIINSDTPVACDLIPLDVNATPDSIHAGQQLDSMDFLIHEYSKNGCIAPFNVYVYLSENCEIDKQDILLTRQAFYRDFSPKSSFRISLTPPKIPDNISPGVYYLGVIVEFSDDPDPSNNDTWGYEDNQRIKILPEITPPNTSITLGPSGTITVVPNTSLSLSFTYTGTDNLTPTSNLVYSYKLDGYDTDWSPYTSQTTKTYYNLGEGSYVFRVRAMDELGNVDPTPATRSFTIKFDNIPPDTSITSGPSGAISTRNVTFTYTGTDNLTPTSSLYYSFKLDGYNAEWSAFSPTTSKSYTNLPNGSYVFMVRATDNAGNIDPTPATRSFTINIDTTPPTSPIGLQATPSGWTNTNTFSIDWTNPSDSSGISAAWYKIGSPPTSDSDGIRTTSKPFNVNSTGEGAKNIYVWLEDGAGNKNHNNASNVVLYYDSSAPTNGTILINDGASQTSSFIVTLNNLGANDPLSGLSKMCFSNSPDGPWSEWEEYSAVKENWNLSQYGGTTEPGLKTVYVRYKDVAGNVSNAFNDTIEYVATSGVKYVCPEGCEYSSIQEAINDSVSGDTIKVAQGTYRENLVIVDSKQLVIEGGWNSDFTERSKDPGLTIIDGDKHRVIEIVAEDGENIDITLKGISIQNGEATHGAGIYASGVKLKLSGCSVVENHTTGGGGVGLYLADGHYEITGCEIAYNTADVGGGGGLTICGNTTGIIAGNTIHDNRINNFGMTQWDGGGILVHSCSVSVIGNKIYNNFGGYGGGVALDFNQTALVANNIIWNNRAANSGGGVFIAHNGSAPTLVNNTIYGNSAPSGNGVEVWSGTDPIFINCIIWGNGPNHFNESPVIFSDVEDKYNGTGNISLDPKFVDVDGPDNVIGTADDDFRLSSASPCIDAGTSEAALPDDFEGDPRPFDILAMDRNGDLADFDIGADEFIPGPCLGDFNHDGDVDGSDLAILANELDQQDCSSENGCKGDFDNNGKIDSSDIKQFSHYFGETYCTNLRLQYQAEFSFRRSWIDDDRIYIDEPSSRLFWNTDTGQHAAFDNVSETTKPGDSIEFEYKYITHADWNTRQIVRFGFTDTMPYSPSGDPNNFVGGFSTNYYSQAQSGVRLVKNGTVVYSWALYHTRDVPTTFRFRIRILSSSEFMVEVWKDGSLIHTDTVNKDATGISIDKCSVWNGEVQPNPIQGTYTGQLNFIRWFSGCDS